ncbi:MAG: hypothetical protein ACRD1K_08945 [Acidimicrobiales bacterium]
MPSRDTKGERGAIAILVSLVLLAVCFPLAGLGYSAYVRSATSAELQRAADSGALAGAAAIPLGDLNFVTNYVNNLTGLAIPLPPGAPDPLGIACTVARKAALEDDGFARNYASPVPDGTVTPVCTARYAPDIGIVGALTSCLNQLLTPTFLGQLLYPTVIQTLQRTLPGLLSPGIEVTLNWNVRGPLDALNPADNGTFKTQTVTSVARRRFKNLVVVPTVPLPGVGGTLNLNPFLATTSATLTGVLNSLTDVLLTPLLTVAGLGSCTGIVTALTSDLSDLINPPDAGAPAIAEVLNAAATDLEPVFVLRIPPAPLGVLAVLNIPFLDFVPVCVAPSLITTVQNLTSTVGCMVNAPGMFRASLAR